MHREVTRLIDGHDAVPVPKTAEIAVHLWLYQVGGKHRNTVTSFKPRGHPCRTVIDKELATLDLLLPPGPG
jgi:hypothetical protein